MFITILAALTLTAKPMVTVSVEGNGFLQFANGGHALYTSSAPLVVVDGWLSYPNGAPLLPTLRVPDGTFKLDVKEDGDVFATTLNYRARVGRISLATFRQGDDLRRVGSFYVSSSLPTYKDPGEGNVGTIHVDAPGKVDPMRDPDPVAMPLIINPVVAPPARDSFVQEWLDRDPSEPALPVSQPISGPAHITIATETDCSGDRYTLGDIAVIDAPSDLRTALMNASLGDTPKPGKKLRLNKDDMLLVLAKQGFETSDISVDLPRHATIVRSCQQISSDDVKQVAIQAASTLLGSITLKASVHIDSALAPAGNLTYSVESCVATKKGATVIVVTNVNGQRYNSHVVHVSISR